MADGTGIPTGRVGSCHIYLKSLRVIWGFFVFYTLIIISAPIPNREVNPPPPRRTNGTGIPTGRVGSCHIYLKEPQSNPGLFVFITFRPPSCLPSPQAYFGRYFLLTGKMNIDLIVKNNTLCIPKYFPETG
jgi:hypothetical protein